MAARITIPKSTETQVLTACRRRCCLCVFLSNRDDIRKGQIAHLNGDPSDSRFRNLVWLCFEHHDEYDSRTSQSKGLQAAEVKEYRDRLYRRYEAEDCGEDAGLRAQTRLDPLPHLSDYEKIQRRFSSELDFTAEPWRYPLWQVANRPELFAYKAGNRADGVCLIERIDLPDGRIVIVCIEIAGNPGNSITNCVEELCFQVCARFDIPAHRLVWLEHYDYASDYTRGLREWSRVTFGQRPPEGPFANPQWTEMTPDLWRDLRLRPKKKLVRTYSDYDSKVTKLFYWPVEALL